MSIYILGHPHKVPKNAILITNPVDAKGAYYLHWQNNQYFLCHKQKCHQPLTIDFSARQYSERGGVEYLPRAFRGLSGESIADVTAGWGKDAWLLASRGFNMTLYERNPYLFLLLQHALEQAKTSLTQRETAQRMTLIFADAVQALPTREFAAIYLDPMYPERRKTAKVKKQMQALQLLLGEEERGENALFAKAITSATNRVIIKRPKGAPNIAGEKPSYTIDAPNTRYDVYVL